MFKKISIFQVKPAHIIQCLSCFTMLTITGCASIHPQATTTDLSSRAAKPVATQTQIDLKSLPKPRGILRAAVYSFRDQSGQYKPQPSNGLSTSVTQGADAILINALLDSKWFAPVERASLQNLLTERKILKSSFLDNEDKESKLPSVAPAEVIIEGSIVSYDSNIKTGGAGLRLLGIGGSSSYREDRVSISIRMVDIDNGLILHNVISNKRIFSRKLETGIFSYVDADKILETEAGHSYNEPSHIAVTEAIESALINLVAEGVLAGTLKLANTSDVNSPVFDRFLSDSERQGFINQQQLAEAQRQEQIRYVNSVKNRMRDGVAQLNRHTSELQKIRAQQKRLRRSNRIQNSAKALQTAAQDTKPVPIAGEPSASKSKRLSTEQKTEVSAAGPTGTVNEIKS